MEKKFLLKISLSSLLTVILLAITITGCQETENEEPERKFHIITSTVEGGNWSDTKTWMEEMVPDKHTDVNITGRVTLSDTAECLNLMVDVGSHLIIEKTGYLKITHHAINEGTIINNGKIELLEDEK